MSQQGHQALARTTHGFEKVPHFQPRDRIDRQRPLSAMTHYRLAILVTHPIQYQVPLFRRLAHEPGLDLKVLYCRIPDPTWQGQEFGIPFQWDVPLLEGYDFEVLEKRLAARLAGGIKGGEAKRIGKSIRDGGFDAVLVSGWNARSYLYALAACRRLRIPCLVRGDSNALRPRRGGRAGCSVISYAVFPDTW